MRLRSVVQRLSRGREPRPAPTTSLTHVDVRGEQMLVTPYAETPDGFWRATGWFRELDPTAPAAEVGAAVEEALAHSEHPSPSSEDDPLAPILRAAGVKSWSQYVKGLRSASVDRGGTRTRIVPMRNLGPRQGLEEVEEKAVELYDTGADELGTAVLRSLGLAVASDVGGLPYFGAKSAWLAVSSDEPDEVARGLGLVEVRREAWAPGLEEVERSEEPPLPVFVTPPLDGWTLAALAPGLADSTLFDLSRLSQTFGEAQRFATHRVVEYHEWQRWVDGSPMRRYCWIGESGEITLDEGEPAAAEAGIARRADLGGDWDELRFADEQTVFAVAAEWSVDPTAFAEIDRLEPDGVIGYVAPD